MTIMTFLKRHWYVTLMLVLSVVNGLLRAFVHFDYFTVIWILFALYWIFLLRYYYKKENKEK